VFGDSHIHRSPQKLRLWNLHTGKTEIFFEEEIDTEVMVNTIF